MKTFVILFLLSGGLATSAAAQAGWGSSNSWDTPKKKTAKKSAAGAPKSQSVSQDKALGNNGAAAAPEAPAPSPAAAAAPSGSGFGGGSASSNAPMGMGMSAAPGTPVMMQSGRNVLRDDAIAARERRMLHRAGKPASSAPAAVAPAEMPVASPAAQPASATGAANAAGGQSATPAAPKPARNTKSPKKAPAAPAGW